jgi:hypothetical protein
MAYEIPTTEPDELYIGDTWKWTKYLGDYPPGTWTLTYTLVMDGEQVQFAASDNGDGTHLVNVAKATTSAYEPGTYKWQASVDDSTDRHMIAVGTVTVLPNYAAKLQGYDARSIHKQIMDALETALLNKANYKGDRVSISIRDRQISFASWEDVNEAYSFHSARYKEELAKERADRGLGSKSTVLVRFQ